MTVCPLCLEHDLALATLFLASHWSFGPTPGCVYAYMCVAKAEETSDVEPGSWRSRDTARLC